MAQLAAYVGPSISRTGSRDVSDPNAKPRTAPTPSRTHGLLYHEPVAGARLESVAGRTRITTDFVRGGRYLLVRLQCTQPFAIRSVELAGCEAVLATSVERDSSSNVATTAVPQANGWVLPSPMPLNVSPAETATHYKCSAAPFLSHPSVLHQWDAFYPGAQPRSWRSMSPTAVHMDSAIPCTFTFDPKCGAFRVSEKVVELDVDISEPSVPQLSIELWMKPAARSPEQTGWLIGQPNCDVDGGRGIVLFDSQYGGLAAAIGLTTGGASSPSHGDGDGGDVARRDGSVYKSAVPFPKVGEWVHIVATFENHKNCALYVNGVMYFYPRPPFNTAGSRGLQLGGLKADMPRSLSDVWLSQLILWSRVLSASDVKARFAAGAARYGIALVSPNDLAPVLANTSESEADQVKAENELDEAVTDLASTYPYAQPFLRAFRLLWRRQHSSQPLRLSEAEERALTALQSQLSGAWPAAQRPLASMSLWEAIETSSWLVFGVPFSRPPTPDTDLSVSPYLSAAERSSVPPPRTPCPKGHAMTVYAFRPPNFSDMETTFQCTVCNNSDRTCRWTSDFYFCNECRGQLTCMSCAKQIQATAPTTSDDEGASVALPGSGSVGSLNAALPAGVVNADRVLSREGLDLIRIQARNAKNASFVEFQSMEWRGDTLRFSLTFHHDPAARFDDTMREPPTSLQVLTAQSPRILAPDTNESGWVSQSVNFEPNPIVAFQKNVAEAKAKRIKAYPAAVEASDAVANQHALQAFKTQQKLEKEKAEKEKARAEKKKQAEEKEKQKNDKDNKDDKSKPVARRHFIDSPRKEEFTALKGVPLKVSYKDPRDVDTKLDLKAFEKLEFDRNETDPEKLSAIEREWGPSIFLKILSVHSVQGPSQRRGEMVVRFHKATQIMYGHLKWQWDSWVPVKGKITYQTLRWWELSNREPKCINGRSPPAFLFLWKGGWVGVGLPMFAFR